MAQGFKESDFQIGYAIRESGCKWLNVKALTEAVMPAGTATIDKVKYYTARVSGATDPDQPVGSTSTSTH